MENNGNVISVSQGAANLKRSFWSFNYPHQVVRDANLNLEEKQAILSAWASDEHTVESLPTLRHLPGTPFPVTFTSIMAARVALDKMTDASEEASSLRPAAINARVQADFGRSGRNNFIIALDRTGRLQMANWRDRPRARADTID
jgi:hypothetical protein